MALSALATISGGYPPIERTIRRKGNRTPYRFAAGSIWASAAVAQEVAATDRN